MKKVNNFIYTFLINALKNSEKNQIKAILQDSKYAVSVWDECYIRAKAPRRCGHTTAMVEIIKKYCKDRKTLVIVLNRSMQEVMMKNYDLSSKNIRFETVFTLDTNLRGCLCDFQFIFFDVASLACRDQSNSYNKLSLWAVIDFCAENMKKKGEPFFYVEIE